MEQSTQTMEQNTTEFEYISIYDRPKRGKGRPKGSKYTDEEKLWDQGYQQKIIIIEILKKKENDIDCYITKKKGSKHKFCLTKNVCIIFFRIVFFLIYI